MIDTKYHKYLIVGSIVLGLMLFILNSLFIHIEYLTVVSILVMIVMPFIIEYNKYTLNKEIEETFPDFLRDISQNIKAGMTLPQAVIATKKTDYGRLDPYLDKMAVQIDWGIPFNKILTNFSKGKTSVIKRTVSVINEAITGGGDISQILDAIGTSMKEINDLRKERQSSTYSQMLTGYIIFFVFLGVIIALQSFLIPSLNFSGSGFANLMVTYGVMFKQLIIIQGFFSGMVIGKMSEGKLISGLKHSIVLIVIGYVTLSIFI
ncbi:MAG: type II secretion system F family protein [Nanoarchaeota archaeon]|nr:type II secretion system F family protein [Nanoarchaeota archaeon]